MNESRPSPIAGLWYPADPRQLKSEIQHYLDDVIYYPILGDLRGLLVPHAGFRYSGKTAAYAYQYLIGKPIETVYILSPYHDYHPADFLTPEHSAYETPLGLVDIDQEISTAINDALLKKTGSSIQPVSRDKEHSLEIQLPFLQTVLKQTFRIVPIMVRSRNEALCQQLGNIIAEHYNPSNSLLIASSDLSHFYHEKLAHQLDAVILNAVRDNQPADIFKAEENKSGFACGAGAITTVMWANKKLEVNHTEILYYTTSAEETRDAQSVVGYAAAAFYQIP
jgi:AmmeMemoRadiSam system protein B